MLRTLDHEPATRAVLKYRLDAELAARLCELGACSPRIRAMRIRDALYRQVALMAFENRGTHRPRTLHARGFFTGDGVFIATC